ncbi:jupiter microtubule associated homolog 1-like isoform X1 [Phyllopteryx taeniolatus]|uniref:jupiter microtubule associated homolog 1a n=1 Tax=Phycodurus eques TaxID=693459 RepID=UPI002ACD721B|nr:jupiter microtubule associated homolog 1a [Phycodurus eques]XP_061627599.1 jupiter microtubule associated homolog 1-like isoform X1 [Phyllopteryx taeniolatus]
MTTTTTYQGMEPGAKNSSRVLRPPGGASNISFGADEDKPPVRKDKMASSVFAEPEDPYANRRNNPPGGKPTGVLCGESSAPLRRGATNAANSADAPSMDGDTPVCDNGSDAAEAAAAPERQDVAPPAEDPAAGPPSGRRNPPGGKSSLILG